MGQRAAERSYGIGDDQLTPAVSWSLYSLRRAWNQAKTTVAPWWAENSKEAYNSGLDAVARALSNWSDSRNGKRLGRSVGFPRFKSRHRGTPSVRFTTGTIGVASDRHHVVLPRLGTIKTHETTRKLARRVEVGTARILSATVRRVGGRWYCSFTVEVQRAQRTPRRPDATVGVDLGVKTLAVLSGAAPVPNRATSTVGCGALGAGAAPWPVGSVPTTRRRGADASRRTGGAAPNVVFPPLTPVWAICGATG